MKGLGKMYQSVLRKLLEAQGQPVSEGLHSCVSGLIEKGLVEETERGYVLSAAGRLVARDEMTDAQRGALMRLYTAAAENSNRYVADTLKPDLQAWLEQYGLADIAGGVASMTPLGAVVWEAVRVLDRETQKSKRKTHRVKQAFNGAKPAVQNAG